MKPKNHKFKPKGKGQPRKDSKTPRVNFDNTREDKFQRDVDKLEAGSWGTTKARNDISWYNHNPEALAGAANFTTMFQTGAIYPWFKKGPNASMQAANPFVMKLDIIPFIAPSDLDTLNLAASDLLTYVVHANSRNLRYNAPDLMINILAGMFPMALVAKGIRLYGIMSTYSGENLKLPESLIYSMGFSPADAKLNYNHMWFDLNMRIARMNNIWIPNSIPLLERWFWINTNVFVDSESIKDQFYVMNMVNFFKIDEVGSTNGGRLIPITKVQPKDWKAATVTWTQYLSAVDEMLDAYFASEDRGIISGDVLKAYGTENLYRMKQIAIDYRVVPTYDPEVLSQIMNATKLMTTCMTEIGQDPNTQQLTLAYDYINPSDYVITTPPSSYSASNLLPDYAYMNFKQSVAPTPEQIVEATRLTALGLTGVKSNKDSSKYVMVPKACGTELVLACDIIALQWMGSSDGTFRLWREGIGSSAITQAFDWRPAIYNLGYPPSGIVPSTTNTDISMDIDAVQRETEYAFPVYWETMKRLHMACITSLLGVPIVKANK